MYQTEENKSLNLLQHCSCPELGIDLATADADDLSFLLRELVSNSVNPVDMIDDVKETPGADEKRYRAKRKRIIDALCNVLVAIRDNAKGLDKNRLSIGFATMFLRDYHEMRRLAVGDYAKIPEECLYGLQNVLSELGWKKELPYDKQDASFVIEFWNICAWTAIFIERKVGIESPLGKQWPKEGSIAWLFFYAPCVEHAVLEIITQINTQNTTNYSNCIEHKDGLARFFQSCEYVDKFFKLLRCHLAAGYMEYCKHPDSSVNCWDERYDIAWITRMMLCPSPQQELFYLVAIKENWNNASLRPWEYRNFVAYWESLGVDKNAMDKRTYIDESVEKGTYWNEATEGNTWYKVTSLATKAFCIYLTRFLGVKNVHVLKAWNIYIEGRLKYEDEAWYKPKADL